MRASGTASVPSAGPDRYARGRTAAGFAAAEPTGRSRSPMALTFFVLPASIIAHSEKLSRGLYKFPHKIFARTRKIRFASVPPTVPPTALPTVPPTAPPTALRGSEALPPGGGGPRTRGIRGKLSGAADPESGDPAGGGFYAQFNFDELFPPRLFYMRKCKQSSNPLDADGV